MRDHIAETMIYGFFLGPLSVACQLVGEVLYWLKNGYWFNLSVDDFLSGTQIEQINSISWIGVKWLINEAAQVWVSLVIFFGVTFSLLLIQKIMGENQ